MILGALGQNICVNKPKPTSPHWMAIIGKRQSSSKKKKQTGVYEPAIIKKIARRSNRRQNDSSFSWLLKAWYKELAENIKIKDKPYINAVNTKDADPMASLNKNTVPITAANMPNK